MFGGISGELGGIHLKFGGIVLRLGGIHLKFGGIIPRLGGIRAKIGGIELNRITKSPQLNQQTPAEKINT